MPKEKEGYRDALERIRNEASGELVTVAEAAHIVYGTDPWAARKVTANIRGWIGPPLRWPGRSVEQGRDGADDAGRSGLGTDPAEKLHKRPPPAKNLCGMSMHKKI